MKKSILGTQLIIGLMILCLGANVVSGHGEGKNDQGNVFSNRACSSL